MLTVMVAGPHPDLVFLSSFQAGDGGSGGCPFGVHMVFVDRIGLVALAGLRPVYPVVGGCGAGRVPGNDEGSGGVAAQCQTGDGSIGILRLRDPEEDAAEGRGGDQQGRQKRQAPTSDSTEMEQTAHRG